ncbi:MAG: hypothetical protein ACT6QT_06560 [Sphingopyxis sp.]|jgi:hypothetical protein|uniref:hypothetical protein n=1 Tax=Sphingopyxis sp. TaxID=1908224 RepID=UPI003F7124F5
MTHLPTSLDRRRLIETMVLAGGAAAFGVPAWGQTPASGGTRAHHTDWQWLVGNWDVWHRRLKERLAGSDDWAEFGGKSACWPTLGGLGTIDDNILDLPGGEYRGFGIRAFDPRAQRWAIWWVDGRSPAHIEPPVIGRFDGDEGVFTGRDTYKGQDIAVRFRWHEIHGPRPHWDQGFSTDDGKTWEINWRNYFTRTAATPTPLPLLAEEAPNARDFAFLVGSWKVRHRRLKKRLAGSRDWIDFDGTLVNWPVLGGRGNVGDNVMNFPGAPFRGVGIRALDPATGEWLSWWLDGRSPTSIAPPVRGGFAGGVGTFIGDDSFEGRPIKTRVLWSRITATSARWEQASSADGGQSWETNWISDFDRTA